MVRGHEAARLREDADERVLPEEGAFAGHVGTGDEPDSIGRADVAVVADEFPALFPQSLRDGRVPARDDFVRGAEVQHGAHVGLVVS